MAVIRQLITNLVAGDNWRIERTYTGLPTALTFSKVYLTIKNGKYDADASAILQKSITTALTSSGQITDNLTTTDLQIALFFLLSPAETILLLSTKEWWYDVQGITDTGAIYTFETDSRIRPLQGITDATS